MRPLNLLCGVVGCALAHVQDSRRLSWPNNVLIVPVSSLISGNSINHDIQKVPKKYRRNTPLPLVATNVEQNLQDMLIEIQKSKATETEKRKAEKIIDAVQRRYVKNKVFYRPASKRLQVTSNWVISMYMSCKGRFPIFGVCWSNDKSCGRLPHFTFDTYICNTYTRALTLFNADGTESFPENTQIIRDVDESELVLIIAEYLFGVKIEPGATNKNSSVFTSFLWYALAKHTDCTVHIIEDPNYVTQKDNHCQLLKGGTELAIHIGQCDAITLNSVTASKNIYAAFLIKLALDVSNSDGQTKDKFLLPMNWECEMQPTVDGFGKTHFVPFIIIHPALEEGDDDVFDFGQRSPPALPRQQYSPTLLPSGTLLQSTSSSSLTSQSSSPSTFAYSLSRGAYYSSSASAHSATGSSASA